VTNEYVAIAYFGSALALTTLLFSVIRFHGLFGPFIIGWMLVEIFLLIFNLIFLISKAIKIRSTSEFSYRSFQRFETSPQKDDSVFWKSCQPLKMQVGSFGHIESHDFLIILFKDVIQNFLIDLLLKT